MAGSNIRSTNHEKCDPQFIRSFSDRKGLGSSKLSWSKMTPSSMKKENGKCESVMSSMSEDQLKEIMERYS